MTTLKTNTSQPKQTSEHSWKRPSSSPTNLVSWCTSQISTCRTLRKSCRKIKDIWSWSACQTKDTNSSCHMWKSWTAGDRLPLPPPLNLLDAPLSDNAHLSDIFLIPWHPNTDRLPVYRSLQPKRSTSQTSGSLGRGGWYTSERLYGWDKLTLISLLIHDSYRTWPRKWRDSDT